MAEERPDLYIDFDGVIHDFKNISDGHRMGNPMPNAVNAIRFLKSRGFKIIVFTVRGDHPYIRDWLRHFNVPFDGVTNIKGKGLYVDDHAIHFDGNWNKVIQQVYKGE